MSTAPGNRDAPHGGTAALRRRPLERFVPALDWLRRYPRSWLRDDLLAGVTTGAVVIPQAMAYGTIAGLPVEVGLYTCIVPMATYALLGGSRRLSMSTTSTIVALTGAGIAAAGVGGGGQEAVATATTLTLLVGALLLAARLLRLAFIVEVVSEAVLSGLKIGVGLSIAASQLPSLLGIPPSDDGFFADIGNAVRHLDDANRWTVAISLATLAVMLGLRAWAPRIPGPLVAVVGGILAVVLLGLEDDGVALIPEVPRGLPVPALPDLDHLGDLLPFALAIAMMAFLESVSVARATREPHDPPLDNGQELVAVGSASVLGSLFSCVPAAGGFSQSLVNAGAGARTQLSELVTAVLAVATALALAPLLSDLPQATLGVIVLVAVTGLLSPADLVRFGRIDPVELVVAGATAAVALVFGLLSGVVAGVLLTFYLVLRSLNHPVVVELRRPSGGRAPLAPARPGDEVVPGMLALRVEGGLYTVNVRGVQTEILSRVDAVDPPPRVVLLDVGGTADTSVTVMDVCAETDEQLAHRGATLWVAALPTRALTKARRTAAYAEWAAGGRLYRTVEAAVAAHEGGHPPGSPPAG